MKTRSSLRLVTLAVVSLALVGCQQGGGSQAAWSVDETGMIVTSAPRGPVPTLAVGETWVVDETGLLASPRPSLNERVDTSLYATSDWVVDETGLISTPRVIQKQPENIIEVWPAD